MKVSTTKVLGAAIMALALGFSTQVSAADGLKIGTVSFQQALNDVQQGKNAKASLKAEFDQKQKKLNLQQDELKKMQEDVEKQKGVLSQDALMAKQRIFNEKLGELQKNMGLYREELVSKEGRMTAAILRNLKGVVADIAKQGGYTLVVETSQDAVLYAESKEDLTAKVVADYNKKFTGALDMGK